MTLKYLTPYLLTTAAYLTYSIPKARAVYITEIDEDAYKITIYNKAHTKIIDEISWLTKYDFDSEYSPKRAKEIQEILDRYCED